jgi:HK97 family phage portal protein
MGDSHTSSGVTLSKDKAASVPEVFSCLQVISQDVGRCPLKLRRVDGDGVHTDAVDHPLWEILADLTNPETTAYQFRAQMQRNLLLHERAYAEIIRNGRGEVVALWPLDPAAMTVGRNGLNQKTYRYRLGSGREITWAFNPSTPPILELTHPSPMVACKDMIGLAYALDLFGAKFFANGARPSGTLAPPTGVSLGDEQRQRLREAFQSMFSGAENAGKVALMEGGMTFTPITIANNEAQYNETRKFLRTLIAGAFRMPPHKIGDLERATFSNIEQQSIDYVTGTLDPFLVAWEQAIRRDMLTTRQFPGYVVQFDRQALIKADIKSLLDALAVGRQNGWYNANDILKKLGENPIDGEAGSAYLVNGNMIPVTQAGQKTAGAVSGGAQ